MRILVACEYSGILRDAYIARGHDAISCDLLPTDAPGPHYLGDVADIINDGWDIMVAFPPCTFLTVAANKWVKDQPQRASGVLVGAERREAREKGIDFFMSLANADIPMIAIENPVGIMSSYFRKPDQVIQPWMFGHGETKATCLWLKGLQRLRPTNIVSGREQRVWEMSPSEDRWKERSKTYPGIAAGMADQWNENNQQLTILTA